MSVKIRVCDRCGKEINETDWDGKFDYIVTYARYSIKFRRSSQISILDLCIACRDQLHEWMEEGKENV